MGLNILYQVYTLGFRIYNHATVHLETVFSGCGVTASLVISVFVYMYMSALSELSARLYLQPSLRSDSGLRGPF